MNRLIIRLALLVALVFTGACGNINRQPRYDIGEPLEIRPFKRLTAHDSQDFLFQWKKTAYSPVKSPIKERLTPDKLDVLTRHGQPDWTRNRWKSTTGEIVDEWAYWDRDVITQFVEGELVYEGELTDMDRYRIRYGYPRRAYAQKLEAGVQRDIWEYQGFFFDADGRIATFSDEKLVSEQRF